MGVYVTGDCHGDWSRIIPEMYALDEPLTKDDVVIVCGDFGIWHDTDEERWKLKVLANEPMTILFVDGNHENFNRLNSDEFQTVDFCGGKAHKIRENIYHLMRGYVFTIQGKKFFCFGGASSHDITDGILDPKDFSTMRELYERAFEMQACGLSYFRIKGLSWWPEELPSDEEMQRGKDSLEANDYKVDFVIAHCLPQSVASIMSMGYYKPDKITGYFDGLINDGLKFDAWYCGHYHTERRLMSRFYVMYDNVARII